MPDGNNSSTIVDAPDLHGFVMLGSETLFVSHLPMFGMTNHRYQIVMRVSLPPSAARQYVEAREQDSSQTYILGNVPSELMTMPQVCSGGMNSFTADIFRGAPQDPTKDVPLIHNVRVRVEKIVLFLPFDFGAEYPATLTYLLFGAGREAHLVHLLTKEPDFDHLVDLAIAPPWLPPAKLECGVHVNFPGVRSHPACCDPPFAVGDAQVQCNGEGSLYPIQVGASRWFDTASLNSLDPCKAER